MDKSAKLKSVAKGLIAGSILGAGAGIAADKQIQKNKHNARTIKGWDTRRNNALTKKAESDTVHDVRRALGSLGRNLSHPTHAAADFAQRSLIVKIRRMISSKPVQAKVSGGSHNDYK